MIWAGAEYCLSGIGIVPGLILPGIGATLGVLGIYLAAKRLAAQENASRGNIAAIASEAALTIMFPTMVTKVD